MSEESKNLSLQCLNLDYGLLPALTGAGKALFLLLYTDLKSRVLSLNYIKLTAVKTM